MISQNSTCAEPFYKSSTARTFIQGRASESTFDDSAEHLGLVLQKADQYVECHKHELLRHINWPFFQESECEPKPRLV
jgi:hypothetical protein